MSFIDYCRVNKLHVKWSILLFITLPEVDGVGDRSLKYFTTFKLGQTLRFKMISASIRFLFLSCSEMPNCCVSRSMVLHYGCFVAIVKVLSTAELVLEYEAGVFPGLQGSLAGCSCNLGLYIS